MEFVVSSDKKLLPYGMMNFADIRLDGYYYVDKTMYIPLIERSNRYFFFIRPRRFGKSLTLNMLKAFLVGGIICCIGQGIMNFAMSRGLDQMNAGKWTSVILVLISVILTGLNIYPTIAKFGGAGALVPITGFANGVAAPAIEFKKEGQVFGIGSQIFSIGGPVILYGIFTSWLLGLVYWIWKLAS